MPKFKIEWGIQKLEDEAIIEANNKEEALDEAFRCGIELLESYSGLHGYPYYGPCLTCDGSGIDDWDDEECPNCCGDGEISWEEFEEDANSWLDYEATEL